MAPPGNMAALVTFWLCEFTMLSQTSENLLQFHIQFMQPYQVIDLDSPGGSGAEAEVMSAELRQKFV